MFYGSCWMLTELCWNLLLGSIKKLVFLLVSYSLHFLLSWLWGLLESHCASLHGKGDKTLEAVRASVLKHLGPSSSCYSSKWFPIWMHRLKETENLWNLCTATFPRASSIHTFRMALLVDFPRTMTFFSFTQRIWNVRFSFSS